MSLESACRSLEDLGEPIRRLLLQMQRNLTDEELDVFTKVRVRQLAKVYDMLALEEDPERILAWLKKEHLKAKGIDPEEVNEKTRTKVLTEGGRDPIAYFKEIERKNMELMAKLKEAQEEREKKRAENIAERQRRREEYRARAMKKKEDAGNEGEGLEVMKPEDVADILGVFERFTSKQSTFDNSGVVQDNEWWKRDEYRWDYEKHGLKGSRWTSVVEGGSMRAPEAEIQMREEWYRVQCWWKTDAQRRNWLAYRDAEWWKEEPYIIDWLDNGENGCMWTAADELSGYNRRGNRRKAVRLELDRRVKWYNANGPKGIVKIWCALSEGSKEHCTVEEKYERDDYYKNGDWWKSETYVNYFSNNLDDCPALRFASAASMDQEWWKQPFFRADFEKGGVLWKTLNEELAVRGIKDFATEEEAERRRNWFKNYWWKGEKIIQDYEKNGSAGKLWQAMDPRSKTLADAVLLRSREEWYLACRETEWWKEGKYVQDWVNHGEQGLLWTSAWRTAALRGDGENKASAMVIKERADYYANNFWKQNKYVKDYMAFGEKGILWRSDQPSAAKDSDWWKSPFFFRQWLLANHAFPGEFWKDTEVISDYWENKAAGKKWTASSALAAILGRGDGEAASSDELAIRKRFYEKYWWRQRKYWNDFCAKGTKWSALTPEGAGKCSAVELKERQNYFEPSSLDRVVLGYQRLIELDAVNSVTGLFVSCEEVHLREQYYQKSWWKTQAGLTDYAFHGENSLYIRAASYDDARALEGINCSSPIEAASRMLFFDNGFLEYSADHEYLGEFIAAADWWQEPVIIADFLEKGENGVKWKACNSASGTCGFAGKDSASTEEQNYRKTFYTANFWRSLECLQDFRQHGIKGKLWTMSRPFGKGERVEEKHLLVRAQVLSGYPEDEWMENMETNWWKAPEVRADFYANGESGCMVSAVNAYVAVERLGTKNEYKADEAELKKRVEFYLTHPLSLEDGEMCHFLYLIEPFWITPESVEDYWTNGLRGKKWNAANVAAFSCSLGEKFTATPAELKRREEVLQTVFWRVAAYKEDFLTHGKEGKLWNKSEYDGVGDHISHEEEVVRISYYLRLSEKYWADCRYAAANWWKAPEVRNDYNINESRGGLVGAATAAVASMGLCKNENYGVSEAEKEKRMCYFKTHPYRDSRVSQTLLSRELARISAMGELFWVHHDCLEDFFLHGAQGTVWSAGDAAAASTGSARRFRAHLDEIRIREAFFSKYWWKASKYRLDFLQNGFEGLLWTKSDPHGTYRQASESEIQERVCYYACAGLECEKRFEEFTLCWWKSPNSIAYYMIGANDSTHIKAFSPQVALSQPRVLDGMAASLSLVENRRHYMVLVTPTDTADDITDSQIMSGVKSQNNMWWKNEAYQRAYDTQRPLEHWKSPVCISDYLNNGPKGKMWTLAGSFFPTNRKEFCSKEEMKERVLYYKMNFWKSVEARSDYELNDLKGTLWSSSEPNGKGKPVSGAELNVRMNYYKSSALWKLAIDPGTDAKSTWCGFQDDLLRCLWYEENWWKCMVRDDYLTRGQQSTFLRASSLRGLLSGSVTSREWQASEEEVKRRILYFGGLGEIEWWQNPVVLSDFQRHEESSLWEARTFKEALLSMGLEFPADRTELERRKRWYHANGWKSAEMVQDYAAGGNKWRTAGASDPVLCEAWMQAYKPVSAEEQARRKRWFDHQPTDEQLQVRRAWLLQRSRDARRIHFSELGDLLAQLNDGVHPSEDEIRAVEDAIRAEQKYYSIFEGVTQQDVMRAMQATSFYIGATKEERMRSEQEALEALQKEEMDRLEEEAAHLAQEAYEELQAAGEEYVPFDEAAEAEEAEYLKALEEEEDSKTNLNEDDVEMTWESHKEEDEDEGPETSEDNNSGEAMEKRQRTLDEAFATGEYGGDVGEEDTDATKGELVDDVKAALEDLVNEDGWKEDDDAASNWNAEQEEVGDAMTAGISYFVLPLREVTNPQYLKGYFTLMRYTPSVNLINTSRKRVWVVDHFAQCFCNLTKNNRIRKEHAAKMLIQLEKNVVDRTRLRMMFFDASHSYDVQFANANERERFYETASAMRSIIRVFAPDLVGEHETRSHVIIDGSGDNAVSVICLDVHSKPVKRQLLGECRINATRRLTEQISIWCGTFNLCGHHPPRKREELQRWMPRGRHDIYAIAVQEASFRRHDDEWREYVQDYLGDDYLPAASMFMWDITLVVMASKRSMLKLTNIEGSTQATTNKSACGNKGGVVISMQYLETSLCFCTCHLPARNEHFALRNSMLEEIIGKVRLGVPDADVTNQFDHVFFFGDFNYRCEIDPANGEKLAQLKDYDKLLVYDQFVNQRSSAGVLHDFVEPAIKFAPTYRLSSESAEYVLKSSPSYCARVLYKSMLDSWIKCVDYTSDPELMLSEHRPVSATFLVRCVRPVMSCFMKSQEPVPEFTFDDIIVKDYTAGVIKKPKLSICADFAPNTVPVLSNETHTDAPWWKKDTLPRVTSVTQVQEYLETRRILLVILEGAEKREVKHSRGTGVVSLKQRVIGKEDVPVEFDSDIVYCGKCVGRICGSMTWHALKSPNKE
ncbi:putative Unc104-like kinesin [Trypanosoma rangeli]|uniref:Putative Unc104-like kinesin n=1 Tax=Trypanosoma rangeli TaxID=5698 RepID=A0A422N7R7_TRYRA|nr:putative Unc104-like kinesin [Trypanosoma rangeli]RNF01518.1 putative Unc104-like kinesin [Trypanosoma rangeli]|eukprot:RNF01518.1 putative Unc104-like kinesin [Trypanosoma rangeli]